MAIPATLDPQPGPECPGAPRDARRRLRLTALGAMRESTAAQLLVHNISATGLLLESPVPISRGEIIAVELPLAGSTPARVVWTSGRLHGCRFEAPVSAATLSAAQLRSAVAPEEKDGADRDEAPEGDEDGAGNEDGAAGEAPAGGAGDETLAQRIGRLRRARELTMAGLAATLGVSKPTVWAWEHGKARPVDERLAALAEALGVPASELASSGAARPEARDIIERSRERIARALGTSPERVRIMLDL